MDPADEPGPVARQAEKKPDKLLELGRNNEFAFDGERITRDELAARIAGLPPETSFLIRADKDLPLQTFVEMADVLKKAKFTHVALQTQNRGRTEAGPTP